VVVARLVLGRQYPGIEDGEVGWDDGEEEKEDADHLGNVKHVAALEKECQTDQSNNCYADDGSSECLSPGFIVIGKHVGPPFVTL